jgi:hypothetical protein
MGSCLGCSPVITFATRYPESALGLVLAQPSGGYRRKRAGHIQFNAHLDYAKSHGLAAVVDLARTGGSFAQEPQAGPWASVIAHDTDFAERFAEQDLERYLAVVGVTAYSLFDRDTIPGAEPEELMALKVPSVILPGHTENHGTSCARYLEECIPGSEYWDVHLESQDPVVIRDHILAFLGNYATAGVS